MNTFLSFVIALLFLSAFFVGSSKADTNARIAIRAWGTFLSVIYFGAALISSWWLALLAFVIVLVCIFIYSLR